MKKKSQKENKPLLNQKQLLPNIKKNLLNNYKILFLVELVKHISLIMLFWNFICTFNTNDMKNIYGEEFFIKPNSKQYLKPNIVKKFNNYMEICKQGELIDKNKYPLLKNPKISVIMPIYNGGKYLHYSLRSIQNQDMKDIEIILVDDCSTDDSVSIIQKYRGEDQRIRLIKNQYNRKILYSKSIAALNSNGQYIIQLDQDDIFIRNDVFDMLYYEAETNNLDLVHIRDFIKRSFHFKKKTYVNTPMTHLVFPREMHYKQQPELTQRNFVDNNNYLLWGLLIKAELYKKSIYKLWPIIMNYRLIFHEDYTISFMIIILTKRYKYLNNFALIHLSHDYAASKNYLENNEYFLGILFFANTLYNYYIKFHQDEIYILLNYINLFIGEFKLVKNKFPDLFKYIVQFVLNSRFLGEPEKLDLLRRLEVEQDMNKNNYRVNKIYKYLMDEKEFNKLCLFQNEKINQLSESKKFDENPFISIIIFCSEFLHLKKTISSIQKQSFNGHEIIIVYDNGTKENFKQIRNLKKQYTNIKLIKNENCEGILCSIYNGLKNATGNYTLILQPGMTLYSKDTLDNLKVKLLKKKYNVVEFQSLINNDDTIQNNSLSLYVCKHNVNNDLNVDKIKINKDYKAIDEEKEILYNKFIRTEKLKEVVTKIFEFSKTQNNTSIYNYYDDMILFALSKDSRRPSFIKTYGTIQYINSIKELNITKKMNDEKQKMEDSLSYITYLFENTENIKEEKMFVLKNFFNILSDIFNRFNEVPMKAFKLHRKFMQCKSIPQVEKNNLELYINSLLN